MSDPVPLEKVLLQVQLNAGVNERQRPETADPTTLLTRVENLVQDHLGAYVKRDGMTLLGEAIDAPTRVLRLKKGLAMVGKGSGFYHYQEEHQKFLKRGVLPEYVVTEADTITGSGASSSGLIYGVASCTNFHAVSADGPDGNTVSLYERESDCVVGRYSMNFFEASAATVMFIADRYLHVYFSTLTGPYGIYGFVIDTQQDIPTTEFAVGAIELQLGGHVMAVRDYATHTTRSIVLANDPGVATYLLSMNNDGTIAENATVTTTTTSISNSGTKLWLMDAVNLRAFDPAAFTTILVAPGAHGSTVGTISATANNIVYLSYITTPAFGSTTLATTNVATSTGIDSTTMSVPHVKLSGWRNVSGIFPGPNGKMFVHLKKCSSTEIVPHVVANVTSGDQTDVTYTNQYSSVRISCTLEPFVGTFNMGLDLRYFSYDGRVVCPIVPIQVTARSLGYAVFSIKPYGHESVGVAQFGGSSYIAGGCHSTYGGDHIFENAFVDVPIINATAGVATGLTGLYNYIAVFKRVDENGSVAWSRTSSIATISLSGGDADKKVNLVICPPCVTNSDISLIEGHLSTPVPVVAIELYRTEAGGTQYHLCQTQFVLASTRFYTVTDSLSDAALRANALLFRQPGTTNSSVDRYPPPSSNLICSHKDRLFTADPYGQRVYYSSFFVDGETAWYNPIFNFFVHGGTGGITGLVSMDGRLFIFKKDGVFAVDGDGPPEGGVAGNEFSSPQRLATEFGCIDPRSICVTTEGIVYRSARGIEILTRSLQVKWIGANVQTTVDANTKTCGSVLDAFGRVHVLVAASDQGSLATVAGIAGAELVYDFTAEAWSVHYSTGGDGVYGNSMQDITMADLDGLGEVVVYADPTAGVTHADRTLGLDLGQHYVPWVVESGWFRTGQQARQRISQVMLLAKKNVNSNHAIRMSLAYNYSDSYTQTFTWQPGDLSGLPIEELVIQPQTPQALAVRVKIEEIAPIVGVITGFTAMLGTVLSYLSNIEPGVLTDPPSFPIGTGRGADVIGITVEIAAKRGAPKLSPGQTA